MAESILIVAIVGGAAAFLVRRWLKLRSGSNGCGCNCGSSCSAASKRACSEKAG